jgi:hypothetical protein
MPVSRVLSREEREKRRALLERFAFRAVPQEGSRWVHGDQQAHREEKARKREGARSEVKFVNNTPVILKGNAAKQKYIVEKEEEPEELKKTHIKLNVITKGKRGK